MPAVDAIEQRERAQAARREFRSKERKLIRACEPLLGKRVLDISYPGGKSRDAVMLELDDGTCLTESWPICEFIEEEHPSPNLFGETAKERAEVRKWTRLFDQECVVPMTMGFRATSGRPMFEPRMPVVSESAGAELTAMSDAKWRWFDEKLGGSNHFALGRFTFADLIVFAFANFGFTIGWKLPDGTDNLARFVDTHNQRDCAAIWQQAE